MSPFSSMATSPFRIHSKMLCRQYRPRNMTNRKILSITQPYYFIPSFAKQSFSAMGRRLLCLILYEHCLYAKMQETLRPRYKFISEFSYISHSNEETNVTGLWTTDEQWFIALVWMFTWKRAWDLSHHDILKSSHESIYLWNCSGCCHIQ